MNKARAMLDALMGPGRDQKKDADSEDWKDKSICKGFAVGFCPFDKAVLGGKRTIEVCGKIHSEVIRDKFAEHKDGKADSELRLKYEEYSIRDLEFVINECSAYAQKEIERMRKEPRNKRLSSEVNQKISQMKRESTAFAQKASALEDCEARQKEQLNKQSEDMMNEMKAYEKEEEDKVIKAFRPLTCEVCGTGYLGQVEGEYEAHLNFKVHDSYGKVRARLKELKDKRDEIGRLQREKKDAERQEKEEGRANKPEQDVHDKEKGNADGDGDKAKQLKVSNKDRRDRDRSSDRTRKKGKASASRERGKGNDRERGRRRKSRSQSRSRDSRRKDKRRKSRSSSSSRSQDGGKKHKRRKSRSQSKCRSRRRR